MDSLVDVPGRCSAIVSDYGKRGRSIAAEDGSERVRRHVAVSFRVIRSHLGNIVRAGEWWEYKLAPIFAVFYATAVALHVPVIWLWPAALTILVALVPGAAYVSLINDFADRADDLAAGKANRLSGVSSQDVATLLAAPIVAGLIFVHIWRSDVLLLSLYLAAWLAFSLYSLSPFRWKSRGLLGVLADAGGAHLFPTLVAVVLAFREAGRPLNAPWVVAVGIWAFGYGLRGILWHELSDMENDRAAGVRTFAQRHGPHVTARLGKYVAFPIEVAALACLLLQIHSVVPILFLAAYAAFVEERVRRWKMKAVIVAPRPQFLIVLHEYYDVFFPAAILITSSLRYPADLAVLAIHLFVFPRRPMQSATDARTLMSSYVARCRQSK
jgi:4-hydroxybenzoate polyprenyltransferase